MATPYMPPPRGGHALVHVDKYLVMFGGCTKEKMYNDVAALDLETGLWHNLQTFGDPPSPRYAHTAVLVANNIVAVFGGYDAKVYYNDLHTLDLSTRMWTKIEVQGRKRPPPRYAHTMTSVSRQLLVFGGVGDSRSYNDVWVFDMEHLKWYMPDLAGIPPSPRSYHTATLVGDKVIIYGGKHKTSFSNDVMMLDLGSKSWAKLELTDENGDLNPISARAYHTASVIEDSYLCILGGYDGTAMFREILLLDFTSMRWIVYGKSTILRCKHTANLVENRMLIFGGHNGAEFVNTVAGLDITPLTRVIAKDTSGSPGSSEVLSSAPPPDKENAAQSNPLLYNTEGVHIRPQLLEKDLEVLLAQVSTFSQHLGLLDKEQLVLLRQETAVLMDKIEMEVQVRQMQEKRKGSKPRVRFGEVAVREHKRGLGRSVIPSDGGPTVGLSDEYTRELTRRLSSYENLREAVRRPRQTFMKQGYLNPNARAQILQGVGHTRYSMEQVVRDIHTVKQRRKETALCANGMMMSESQTIPQDSRIAFHTRESESM